MNAAELMQTCPTEETLAAFHDQQLSGKKRMEVVAHLADCDECRDTVVLMNEYARENEAQSGEVARGRFGMRRWPAPLAAAAALAVAGYVGIPWYLNRPMAGLVEAGNGLKERTTEARLSGDFVYKVHTRYRGANEEKSPAMAAIEVDVLAAGAEEKAEKSPSARNLHTAGVGELLRDKDDRDVDKAVAELERAAQDKPKSAAIQNDLAAAYLTRLHTGDAQRALNAADTAWRLDPTPAAAWNRALALTRLDQTEAAIAAWQKYLELDPNSEWAKEVRERQLPDLQ